MLTVIRVFEILRAYKMPCMATESSVFCQKANMKFFIVLFAFIAAAFAAPQFGHGGFGGGGFGASGSAAQAGASSQSFNQARISLYLLLVAY